MPLDKELYRQVYQAYRQMNEAEVRYRLHSTDKLSPQEAWRQYADLWEFGWQLGLQPSGHQQLEKLASLQRYYDSIQMLEARRRARGRTS